MSAVDGQLKLVIAENATSETCELLFNFPRQTELEKFANVFIPQFIIPNRISWLVQLT